MSRELSPIEQEMQAMQRAAPPSCEMLVTMHPGIAGGIARMAKERGLKPRDYASQLLTAAYSARRGPVGDSALERAVADIDVAGSADAQVTMLRLRLDEMRGEQQNMDARQAKALAERDRTINELQDRLTEAEGRSAVARAEIASERERLRADLAAARDAVIEDKTTAAPAPAPAARGHRDMVDRGRDEAPAHDADPLSPAFVRSCVGFRAVGNSPGEIARLMRCDVGAVRRALAAPRTGRGR